MATDIYGMLSGALNYSPEDERRKQQEMFQQRLMQSTSPQQFIATVGSNLGSQLGGVAGSLLGGKTSQEVQSQAIQEAYRYASQDPNATQSEKMSKMAEYLGKMPGMQGIAMSMASEATRLSESEFKGANRTREMKETRNVYNPLTQMQEPRTFSWTEIYDPAQRKWVKATMPQEEQTDTPKGEPPPKTDKEKSQAALAKRAKIAPVAIDPNMPTMNVSP